MNPPPPKARRSELIRRLQGLYQACLKNESEYQGLIASTLPKWQDSARNFLHYLVVRSYDMRDIHDHLSAEGVSSLRSAESHTLDNLKKTIQILCLLNNESCPVDENNERLDFYTSRQTISDNAAALLGNHTPTGNIMVTIPPQEAGNAELITALLMSGMTCARINCAHGNPGNWHQMVDTIRTVEHVLKRHCQIHFDLAGPKIRIAKISGGRRFLSLNAGDKLTLVFNEKHLRKGENAIFIDCPAVRSAVKIGDRVLFSDGRFSGRVSACDDTAKKIEASLQFCEKGKKLKVNKGLNLPDSAVNIPCLTRKDIEDLDSLGGVANSVGLSFVRCADDVKQLQMELRRRNLDQLGVVVKIETQQAVDNLPEILLQLMQSQNAGLMLARGDLAVEIGFERIAEIQEEILWLCEAAHIPTIWATQVLQNLAKNGMATRAEITDAAMSGRAECVMLNTGRYLVESVTLLNGILRRMKQHRDKCTSQMRPLGIARKYFDSQQNSFLASKNETYKQDNHSKIL